MGCDRMGFGTGDDRFSAARTAVNDRGSDTEEEDVRNLDNLRRGVPDDDVEMVRRRHDELEEKSDTIDAENQRSGLRPMHVRPLGNQRVAQMRARAATDNDAYHSDDTDIEEEMMRIDPVDIEWRRQLHAGDPIDAQNVFGNWCPAMILQMLDGEAHVRYLNMNDSWIRWLPADSAQLAPPATKTRNDSAPLRLAQVVEVRKPGTAFWKEAHVVKARPSDLLVRYAGRQQQFDEWMPFTPDNVAAAGDHVRQRSFADQRRLSVKPNVDRSRVIQAQNPRFQHYHNALAAQGLRTHAVEGDGNCLFRSVSHQVYGDDKFHTVVRQMCMDYMESEKEYFEPYVVGDMSAFLRYLQHKRRDGVWGDDPEIQAMCELYDRPAEVYAYDPQHGFRKLRTFHENSALSRTRPPICLSYYGGGHYDSIVGPQHGANLIREPPGEWERRHLVISRRINTREGGSISSQRVTESTPTTSEREAVEMAQLEQILMLSRNEFDAMRSNLDETLKRTLAESETTAAASEQRELDQVTRESELAAIQAELLEKARQQSEEELMHKVLEASLQEQERLDPPMDYDSQVYAAIEASLRQHTTTEPSHVPVVDEEQEMQRILELSAKEYQDSAMPAAYGFGFDSVEDNDEMDELQRAIQASLADS